MLSHTVIDGKEIRLGDILKARRTAAKNGICESGESVTVHLIKDVDGEIFIGLYCDNSYSSWGNLDGAVLQKHGLWFKDKTLLDNFELEENDFVVDSDFLFKNRNLKGMKCKILSSNSANGHCFAKFEENIRGGGADGLCKAGHCVIVPNEILKKVSKSNNDNNSDVSKRFGNILKKSIHDYVSDEQVVDIVEDPITQLIGNVSVGTSTWWSTTSSSNSSNSSY